MRTMNIRTLHSETWQYGPQLCPRDMEMLLKVYCPGEYNRFSSEDMNSVFYDIPSAGVERIIDALSSMSEEKYKNTLCFEDAGWLNAKEVLIAEFQFLYRERDMTWEKGERMVLGWF